MVQVPAFEYWLIMAQWLGSNIELHAPLARVRAVRRMLLP